MKEFLRFLRFFGFTLCILATFWGIWYVANYPQPLALWYSKGRCQRVTVASPQKNMGKNPHWYQIVVYDQNNNYLGPFSNYHKKRQEGCSTYFGGDSHWKGSYYHFHGTKKELRQRGLPRYIKIRFVDSKGIPYSKMSRLLDLSTLK